MADKLIRAGDLFKAVCDDTSIRGTAFAAIRRHIDAAPAVKAVEVVRGRWIPFTDPPKRLKAVICLYKNEDGTQVGGGYVNDHGIWTLIGPAKGTITHWMHMPELPKEG